MFNIYCNNCYQGHKDNPSIEYYLSTCGHIFCKACCQSVCTICKRSYNPILICKTMPPELAILFESTEKLYRDFQRVTQFQMIQRAYFAHYHINILPDLKKKALKERHGLLKLNQRINEMLDQENQRIQKLKEYLAYHERRLEQAAYKSYPVGVGGSANILQRRASGSSIRTMQAFMTASASQSQPHGPSTPPLSSNDDGSSRPDSEPSLLTAKENNNDFQL